MMDADYYCPSCAFDVGECKCDKPNTEGAEAMTTQKMTEEEAIAYLRANPNINYAGMGDAIRTVCDALEGARRAVPVGYVVLPSECDERMIGAFNECAAAGNEYPDTFLAALVAAAPAQPATETAGDARLSNEPYRSRALVAMQKVYEEAPRVTVYTLADMLDVAILAAQGAKS